MSAPFEFADALFENLKRDVQTGIEGREGYGRGVSFTVRLFRWRRK